MSSQRLAAAMLVRNEAGRYLKPVLDDLIRYCDAIVVLDDASTDETPDICRSYGSVILHRNPAPLFWRNECLLRSQLWHLAVAAHPDWILVIDADEVMEERFKVEKDRLLGQDEYDVIAFWLYTFWNDFNHYRVDEPWSPQPKRMLVRHRAGMVYRWDDFPIHSERIPNNLSGPILWSDLRCRHFGNMTRADRLRKHRLYTAVDPRNRYDGFLDGDALVEAWCE